MNTRRRIGHSRSAGFSLIELMVGLVIGLIAIAVVLQVFKLSEGAKRTTTSGDDAQTSGAIALSALQRDIRQAGYGVSAHGVNVPTVLGCSLALATGTVNAVAPVTINPAGIPAGDRNTDTLLIMYGSSAGSAEGDQVLAHLVQTDYTVKTPAAFAPGDFIIAEPTPRPASCNLTMEKVTAIAAVPPTVTVATGVAGMTVGTLFNLGPEPRVLVYAVRRGALTVCDYRANDCGSNANKDDSNVWVPIGDNIVSLRAVYGQDTTAPTMDAVVDSYDRTTPTTECGWARVSAIRLALVARSAQVEKAAVPASAPDWSASAVAPIDLTDNDYWQLHRYRTFETTVPLRNMAWQGVQAGC